MFLVWMDQYSIGGVLNIGVSVTISVWVDTTDQTLAGGHTLPMLIMDLSTKCFETN